MWKVALAVTIVFLVRPIADRGKWWTAGTVVFFGVSAFLGWVAAEIKKIWP
jgi:hypothetical protein